MRPERLAGTGLAFAALTIVALALLARFELDREASLHRETIARLQVKDSLESLRIQLAELTGAARLAALAPEPRVLQAIERRAVEIDAELDYLAQNPARGAGDTTFEALADAARLLAVNARSMAGRPREDLARAAAEIEALAERASESLQAAAALQRARINEATLAQIRTGETLRRYVAWLVPGSIAVLLGLFGFYLWARRRERAARSRIEHLAHYDTLTALPNRALLAERLQQELARARRDGSGLAVLLFDLDGFKGVNDTWGHAAGDHVLALAAERARRSVRGSDTVGRLGGDEFLAILPEAGPEGARRVAEKLLAALAAPYEGRGFSARLSASAGASFYPADGDDAEALQKAADRALYEAKRAGKNRVALAGGREARAPAEASP